MAELRYNPLIKDWVIVASHRQNRPQMPENWCPFCIGSDKIPEHYDVLKYDNDFPALSDHPPVPDDVSGGPYKLMESYGKCEVILYSPDHNASLSSLEVPHIRKLVDLWNERFLELQKDKKNKYIFIFENRGAVVGVTMPHPHGQIYAYPFIPKKIELELNSTKEYFNEHKSCMICDMNKEELRFKERVIFENDSFVCFVPFFSEYPYGTYIVSKNHKTTINEMNEQEKNDLALSLKQITLTYDNLFGYAFPYMLCMHQAPVNDLDASEFYHFHIEFFPPMRSYEKQKFNASSETGVWAHCNPTAPEEKAAELKKVYQKLFSNVEFRM